MKIRKLMEANEPLEDVSYSLEVEQDFDGPDVGVETGVSGLLLDQISKVAQNINDYNMMRANLEGYPEIDDLIQSLADQENETLGKLQSALKSISPNAELIMNGAVEAESELDPGSPIDEAVENKQSKSSILSFNPLSTDKVEFEFLAYPKGKGKARGYVDKENGIGYTQMGNGSWHIYNINTGKLISSTGEGARFTEAKKCAESAVNSGRYWW